MIKGAMAGLILATLAVATVGGCAYMVGYGYTVGVQDANS